MKCKPFPNGCAHGQPSSKGDVFSTTAQESLLVGINGARISRSPGQPSFVEGEAGGNRFSKGVTPVALLEISP